LELATDAADVRGPAEWLCDVPVTKGCPERIGLSEQGDVVLLMQ
jgi:hypothetical protein